jgi:predicted ATP-grasp superfamily ATP-dependent carboligase
LSKYALLDSEDNIHNFVSKYYEQNSWFYQQYFKAFINLKKLSKDWEYYEAVPELSLADIDDTDHPNAIGHKKIANHILSKI